MTSQCNSHGVAIGISRIDDRFLLTLKAEGMLSHEDYKTITPFIDAALAEVKHPRVDALIDATELEGWEPRAAWDDFKLGLKHGNQFQKIAIVGNKKWQQVAAKMATWFMSGEARYFEDKGIAQQWLQA